MQLHYREIFLDEKRMAVKLPFAESLQDFHPHGCFPLVEDPKQTGRTVIIGMFVLRPAHTTWKEPIIKSDGSCSVYDVKDWVYNINTISGGGIIANGNIMDGCRLGMQYAITDAVIIGSSTVLNDGIPRPDGSPGYRWLPCICTEWPHLKQADPRMMERFLAQRRLLQNIGYASPRTYPAQIVVTRSGKATDPDLLKASIFHEHLPDGKPIEAYIVTSRQGAELLRARASKFGLGDRIEEMLIILSPPGEPGNIDLKLLPEKLYNEYNIIMANHDGGAKVLKAFCAVGIVPQFNFTFARTPSLYDVVATTDILDEARRRRILTNFHNLVLNFFSTADGTMPREFAIVQVLVDGPDEAAILVLDTRKIITF
ncbi:MAG: hypothetical protein AB1798_11675 [Spirochaetota bacterium]